MNMKKTAEMWTTAAAGLLIAALLAVAALAQSASFQFFGPLSRVVTPNGDGKNDVAIFCFDNPAASAVSGGIFSLLGSAVATLGPANANASGSACPAGALPGSDGSIVWDGRSNGSTVRGGIYVYRITAEQKSYTGTIIVVR